MTANNAILQAGAPSTGIVPKRLTVVKLPIVFALAISSIVGWIVLYDDDSAVGTAVLGGYRDRWFILNSLFSYFAVWFIALTLAKTTKIALFKVSSIHLGLLLIIATIETMAIVGLLDFRTFLEPGAGNKRYGKLKPDSRLRWAGTPYFKSEGLAYPNLARIFGVSSEPIAYSFQTDRFGLRNEDGKQEPAVLLLGDSILLAGLLPFEETVTTKLAESLGVHVLNISEPGYSPQEELIRLRTTGLELRGKIVLHFIFEGNDLSDSNSWREWRTRRFTSDWPYSGLIKNILGLLHRPKAGAAERRFGLFRDSDGNEERIYFLYDGKSIASHMDELPHLESTLLYAKDKVTSEGGAYAIVFVPAKITVLHRYCRWPAESDFKNPDTWTTPFRKSLSDLCKQLTIPFYDLTKPLSTLADSGLLPYFALDTHLNATGHAAMASYLTTEISNLMRLQ